MCLLMCACMYLCVVFKLRALNGILVYNFTKHSFRVMEPQVCSVVAR